MGKPSIANRPTWALILALLPYLEGCSAPIAMTPSIKEIDILDQLQAASVIVLGTVESEQSVKWVGSEEEKSIELRKVIVKIEGVLEGDLKGAGQLSFYYFAVTGAWHGSMPNLIAPNVRAVFYLIRDGIYLRATTDGYLSHTPVWTGPHQVTTATEKEVVRQQIGKMLLLPVPKDNVDNYVGAMSRSNALAYRLIPRSELQRMMLSVFGSSDSRVRNRACLVLADSNFDIPGSTFDIQGCLAAILANPNAHDYDRRRAKDLVTSNGRKTLP